AVDGLQAGAAVAVESDASDLDRQSSDERRHAGHVVALLALLFDTAPLNVFNIRSWQLDTLQQGAHQVRRSIVGAHVAVNTFFGMRATDGRADGVDDNGMSHGKPP